MNHCILTTVLLFILISQVKAQEKLYSLEHNASVSKKYNQTLNDGSRNYRDTVFQTLPFFDDFSLISVWPSPARWADNYVFINTDYAKFAPTIGVATFDAIDETGALYPTAGPYQFEADRLTSQPIRLDSLFSPTIKAISRSDSLYLSFYFQPQGKGSMPAKKDSLILEFHSPAEFDTIAGANDTTITPRWHSVWSSTGGVQVDTFALQNGSYFKQVLIPINDSALYYKKGFRFRFRNYASLANNYVPDWQSNGDQWNIDVVFLSTGRSFQDTVIKDVAFADRAPSMLRHYEAMPYRQYCENYVEEMKDTLDIFISNLDKNPQNLSYKYKVQRDSQAPFITYDGGSYSIFPFQSSGYSTYQPFARPPVIFLYSPFENQEKIVFHSTHYLTGDPALIFQGNDTIRYTQVFSNYYAYDDGTAEAGVGLNGAAGSYAVRFALNKEDTLRGIQIYFNQVRSGAEDQYFDLAIWDDSFGKPGQVIRLMSEVTPIYTDSLNTFHTYWFDKPLMVDAVTFPGLIFYAGWQQTFINNLNVGLDRYNDSHENRFYNVDGTWQMSDYQHAGSLLLRPIVGMSNPLGIDEIKASQKLEVFPNPYTDGMLNIKLPSDWNNQSDDYIHISFFDGAGIKVIDQMYTPSIMLNNLTSGLYLVTVFNSSTGETASNKLIIK